MKRRDVTAQALSRRGWAPCRDRENRRYDLEDVAHRCREGARVRFNTSALTGLTLVLIDGEAMLWRKATRDELVKEARNRSDSAWERRLNQIQDKNRRTAHRKYGC